MSKIFEVTERWSLTEQGKHKGRPREAQKRNITRLRSQHSVSSLKIPTLPRNRSPGTTPTHSNNVSDDECNTQSIGVSCERTGPLKTCWMKRVLIAMKSRELEVMANKQCWRSWTRKILTGFPNKSESGQRKVSD